MKWEYRKYWARYSQYFINIEKYSKRPNEKARKSLVRQGFSDGLWGGNRPLKIRFIDDSQSNLLSIERRWVFILSKYTVHDNNGMLLAVIKQKFRIGTSYFEVYGPEEEVLFTCSNKPFHWWTFNVEFSICESSMIL